MEIISAHSYANSNCTHFWNSNCKAGLEIIIANIFGNYNSKSRLQTISIHERINCGQILSRRETPYVIYIYIYVEIIPLAQR